ncbi:MAG: acetyl-CoA carboxylase biotin carboxyl carrier protein subunit [Chloroflexi bacterium]|nr:acetyl-CoA carboxylase biotin carboxyl carrier protein subunit [Chloroflexota bacterium]
MNIQINKPIKIVINGKTYEVEVDEAGDTTMTVCVNGEYFTVELEEEFRLASQPKPLPAAAEPKTPPAPPKPAPVTQPVRPVQTPTPAAGPGQGFQIKAPMPGTILDINVKVGETVQVGKQLCALEAMKMKNAIRAPKEGVVASVNVNEGQTVAYGMLLFILE